MGEEEGQIAFGDFDKDATGVLKVAGVNVNKVSIGTKSADGASFGSSVVKEGDDWTGDWRFATKSDGIGDFGLDFGAKSVQAAFSPVAIGKFVENLKLRLNLSISDVVKAPSRKPSSAQAEKATAAGEVEEFDAEDEDDFEEPIKGSKWAASSLFKYETKKINASQKITFSKTMTDRVVTELNGSIAVPLIYSTLFGASYQKSFGEENSPFKFDIGTSFKFGNADAAIKTSDNHENVVFLLYHKVLPKVKVGVSYTYNVPDKTKALKAGFEHAIDDDSKLKLVFSQGKVAQVTGQFSSQLNKNTKLVLSSALNLSHLHSSPFRVGSSIEFSFE